MRKNKNTSKIELDEIYSISNKTNTNLLKAILDSSPNIIVFALDTQYNYLAFNNGHKQVMQSIWGKDIELGMNMLDVIGSVDDQQKAKSFFDRALCGDCFVDETEYGDEILSRKYWQTHYSPIYDDIKKNIIGLTCFNLDISEQKNKEKELHLAELSLNIITDAIYLINSDLKIIYVNQAACDTLGYTKEELLGKTPFDIDPIVTLEKIDEITESVTLNQEILFETKHKKKDGSIIDVKINIYPYLRDNICYRLSIVKDITERKKTDEKLKLLASVFRSSKEGIVITDTDARILDVNEAYMEITGYSKDELIGKNASILKSGKHDEEFYKEMWNKLSKDRSWNGVIWNRKKCGELFEERLVISAISDFNGKISSYVGLISDITVSKEYEYQLRKMAFYDFLTGLPNRVLLLERMNQAMKTSKRLKTLSAICYVDLDGFKPVNDNLGHGIGDELLAEISNRMQKNVRESDTVARIGGDEFAILLFNIKNKQECEKVVEKILKSIDKPYKFTNKKSAKVTASIGIAMFTNHDHDAESLLHNADQAMYLAKESGKNRYFFF